MYYIVYKTTNLVNKKIYVGVHKTSLLEEFDGYLGSGTVIKRAIEKYGKSNFKRDTLFVCDTKEEAYDIESIIVDESFLSRKDVYNQTIGGFGNSLLGSTVVELGIGIHALSFEERSAISKNRIENTPRELILERASIGGIAGSAKCKELGVGFFGYTKEQRIEYGNNSAKIQKELGINRFDPLAQAELGKRGGPKNKNFKWYNDSISDYKYTYNQQKELSFEEFLNMHPEFTKGRTKKPSILGSKWYNDGVKEYNYTLEQQKELPFEEFINNNTKFNSGRIKRKKI
jgi:hypothetical protein